MIERIKQGKPPIVTHPRSYEWEEVGPVSSDPAIEGSMHLAHFRTLTTGIGKDAESIIKAVEAICDGFVRESRYDELRNLQLSTLIAVSAHDPRKTVENSYELHQLLPNSEWILFPDAYHTVNHDDPVTWNATVHAFLERSGLN